MIQPQAALALIPKLESQERYHASQEPWLVPQSRSGITIGYVKPNGLWYAFGGTWVGWCFIEQPGWLRPYVYRVRVPSGMLRIETAEQFHAFEREYAIQISPGSIELLIDWERVRQRYPGCEITPYQYTYRLESVWYYGWDCASGVVWDMADVKMELLYRYQRSGSQRSGRLPGYEPA